MVLNGEIGIEDEMLKVLVIDQRLFTYKILDNELWISANTIKDVREAEVKLKVWNLI